MLHEIIWGKVRMAHETFTCRRKKLVTWKLKVAYFLKKYLYDWLTKYINDEHIIILYFLYKKEFDICNCLIWFLKKVFFPQQMGQKILEGEAKKNQFNFLPCWTIRFFWFDIIYEVTFNFYLHVTFVWQFHHKISSQWSWDLFQFKWDFVNVFNVIHCSDKHCWFPSHNGWRHHGWSPSVWQFLAHNVGLLDPVCVFLCL